MIILDSTNSKPPCINCFKLIEGFMIIEYIEELDDSGIFCSLDCRDDYVGSVQLFLNFSPSHVRVNTEKSFTKVAN